jgi:hypothetical protein
MRNGIDPATFRGGHLSHVMNQNYRYTAPRGQVVHASQRLLVFLEWPPRSPGPLDVREGVNDD